MTELSGKDQQTYDSIFRHPVSGNIEWHSVFALFGHLGEVVEEPNGKVKLLRNGHAMTMHTKGKDATLQEVEDMRKFLKSSEEAAPRPEGETGDYLLVLTHSEARIYRAENPEAVASHIEPYDPFGWDQHVRDTHETALPHTNKFHREFFEKISAALAGADRILIFGDGEGSSQEFDRLLSDLRHHHPEIIERVVETKAINLSHMTDGEVLAKAREAFALVLAPQSEAVGSL